MKKLNIWRDSITDRIPLHRFCTPAEVGDAVVFLDSEGARYITGTTLYMDGGALLPVLAENSFIPCRRSSDYLINRKGKAL